MTEIEWLPMPENGKRYLLRVRIGPSTTMSITGEYVGGMWLVDGIESGYTVIAYAELPPA